MKFLVAPDAVLAMGTAHVPSTGFLNGASNLKQYFVLPLNGSKYCFMYTFKAIHVLGVFDPSTSLM